MIPNWLERISPSGREVLADVARRSGLGNQGALLAALTSGKFESGSSRQALHAQLGRARSTVAVGSVLLAASDDAVLDFVLSRDFPWLRPFSAETQHKWPHMGALLLGVNKPRSIRLFERGQRLLFDLAPRAGELDQLDLLRMHSAIMCMFMGPLRYPREFIEAWTEVWDEAEHRGLLANPQLRIRLGALGGWVGTDEAQIAAVFDSNLYDYGLCDAYCFVRSDTRDDIYHNTAVLLRGDKPDPFQCLLPGKPTSTIRSVVDYIRASFRDQRHLRTPGQALYLLAGLGGIEAHARELQARGIIGDALDPVFARLRGFGELQLMEKKRFWELCDRLPDGEHKQRLISLWQHDYGRAQEGPAPDAP